MDVLTVSETASNGPRPPPWPAGPKGESLPAGPDIRGARVQTFVPGG